MDQAPVVQRLKEKCFLVICRDGPDAPSLRERELDGHLHHVEQNWRSYVTAGPIRKPGGERIIGSVFLVLAENLNDVQTLMSGDPYITCGMYQAIEYSEFTNSIGQYIGGKIWKDVDSIRHRATGEHRFRPGTHSVDN